MKRIQTFLFLYLVLSVAFTFSACGKKKPVDFEPASTPPPSGMAEPSEPPPSVERPTTEGPITTDLIDEVTRQMQPVFFDFNQYDIREDMIPSLQNNARVMKQNTTVSVLVEGHCDERGTDEYNLALGERRAGAAKDFLISLGIAENKLSTLSYGESRPFSPGHDEDSWAQNRRAHFVAVRN